MYSVFRKDFLYANPTVVLNKTLKYVFTLITKQLCVQTALSTIADVSVELVDLANFCVHQKLQSTNM